MTLITYERFVYDRPVTAHRLSQLIRDFGDLEIVIQSEPAEYSPQKIHALMVETEGETRRLILVSV